MLEDVTVYRLVLSEQDRIGVGAFRSKDEKNQDSTEFPQNLLICSVKRGFCQGLLNFEGELDMAKRVKFMEVFKLDVASWAGIVDWASLDARSVPGGVSLE